MLDEVDWFSVTTLLLIPLAGGAALVTVLFRIRASRNRRLRKAKELTKAAASGR